MPGYAAGILATGHVSGLQSDGQETSPALAHTPVPVSAPALQQPTENRETWRGKSPSSCICQELLI